MSRHFRKQENNKKRTSLLCFSIIYASIKNYSKTQIENKKVVVAKNLINVSEFVRKLNDFRFVTFHTLLIVK